MHVPICPGRTQSVLARGNVQRENMRSQAAAVQIAEVRLSLCLSLCLSVGRSVGRLVGRSVGLFVCLSACLPVCLCVVALSLSLAVSVCIHTCRGAWRFLDPQALAGRGAKCLLTACRKKLQLSSGCKERLAVAPRVQRSSARVFCLRTFEKNGQTGLGPS